MSIEYFFTEAPVITWWEYLKRNIMGSPREPTRIEVNPNIRRIPNIEGVRVQVASYTKADEYIYFIRNYFYNSSTNIELVIPRNILLEGLQRGNIRAIEVRERVHNELIGFVASLYAGNWKGEEMGLITWLCVKPQWRKKGVTNILLRTLYNTGRINIYWWRNDLNGGAPIPPVSTEIKILRKKRDTRTSISIQDRSTAIKRVSYEKWKAIYAKKWLEGHKEGILLYDPSYTHGYIEAWERQITATKSVVVFICPTFEVKRNTDERYCEVIGYMVIGGEMSRYEVGQNIEVILDKTPYMWFESVSTLPRLEDGWLAAGQSKWYVFGLDPGIPVTRNIASLCSY
jgi:hypothetical protein